MKKRKYYYRIEIQKGDTQEEEFMETYPEAKRRKKDLLDKPGCKARIFSISPKHL